MVGVWGGWEGTAAWLRTPCSLAFSPSRSPGRLPAPVSQLHLASHANLQWGHISLPTRTILPAGSNPTMALLSQCHQVLLPGAVPPTPLVALPETVAFPTASPRVPLLQLVGLWPVRQVRPGVAVLFKLECLLPWGLSRFHDTRSPAASSSVRSAHTSFFHPYLLSFSNKFLRGRNCLWSEFILLKFHFFLNRKQVLLFY